MGRNPLGRHFVFWFKLFPSERDCALNAPRFLAADRYAQLKEASRTNSTFGFLPTRKPTQKKPKELFFANARKKKRTKYGKS